MNICWAAKSFPSSKKAPHPPNLPVHALWNAADNVTTTKGKLLSIIHPVKTENERKEERVTQRGSKEKLKDLAE